MNINFKLIVRGIFVVCSMFTVCATAKKNLCYPNSKDIALKLIEFLEARASYLLI